jgi:hypothetical protein
MSWIKKASYAGRHSPCQGKEAFSTAAAALRVLRKMRHRHPDDHALNVYRCRHCSKWHIGESLERRRAQPHRKTEHEERWTRKSE